MSMLEEVRTRILGGGAGAGILTNLQARVAQIRSPETPQLLKGPLITELREKGALATVMARVEKFRGAPPAAPPTPPTPEAKRGKVSIESVEGVYAPRPPPYAGPLTYEALSPNTKAWLPVELWPELTAEEKLDAVSGAGLGYQALRRSVPWRKVEFYTPGKVQRGRFAAEG